MNAESDRIISKHATLEAAQAAARDYSTVNKGIIFSVIESRGEFYVETGAPFIRSWEALRAAYRDGRASI